MKKPNEVNMLTYLIDGNNLIGKINILKSIHEKNKQSSRENLVFLIEDFFHNRKAKIFLHFDGFENTPLSLQNGKIIYSEKTNADKKIRDQIEFSKNRKNLIVVSSDHEIQNFAKVCGCKILSSEEFGKIISRKSIGDEEEDRIKSMNNVEEFKKLFNVRNGK